MPTNLPPEYFAAEKRYRQAQSPAEKIACLEEMLSTIPKHKGTDHLRADYRRQLSRLKSESQSRKRASAQQSAFRVEREGAGQAVLVGPTNVGKSALLAALTNASPQVDPAPYTTWRPAPGMMLVEDVQVQLVDTPPLDREYVEPALIDLIRRTDLVLPVVDLQTFPQQQLLETMAILSENRIVPAFLPMRQPATSPATVLPFLVIANKCDDESLDEICEIFLELLQEDWPMLAVSALTGRGLDRLKQAVFEQLELVRVYAKPPGKDPDYEQPFVLKKGATVEQLAGRVHKDFLEKLKYARVWGSAEFDGQMVQRDYVLQDGDVVELRL
jgi:ribosome-interacting GTPase 1